MMIQRRNYLPIIWTIVGILFSVFSFAQNKINAFEASQYVGDTCIVVGQVAQVKIINNTKGGVAFIDLEKLYPGNPLKVVIFGRNFKNFFKPIDELYQNKKIEVKGVVTVDKNGATQIIVDTPDAISVVE